MRPHSTASTGISRQNTQQEGTAPIELALLNRPSNALKLKPTTATTASGSRNSVSSANASPVDVINESKYQQQSTVGNDHVRQFQVLLKQAFNLLNNSSIIDFLGQLFIYYKQCQYSLKLFKKFFKIFALSFIIVQN